MRCSAAAASRGPTSAVPWLMPRGCGGRAAGPISSISTAHWFRCPPRRARGFSRWWGASPARAGACTRAAGAASSGGGRRSGGRGWGRARLHSHSGRIDLWLRTPLRRLLVRLALTPASRVLTVSETSRKFLARSLGSARVILVDNGVDPAAYTPVAAPGHELPTILFAGVLSPR